MGAARRRRVGSAHGRLRPRAGVRRVHHAGRRRPPTGSSPSRRSPTGPGSTWSRSRTTPTSRVSSTPGRCSRSSRPAPGACAWPPTSTTCRCARPPCWRAPWRASTSSAAAAPSSASARAPFRHPIVAMGGPRRTPRRERQRPGGGHRPDARALGRRSAPGRPLRGGSLPGLRGAARGPAPLHDVQIWVGALKPRMLDLIGRKGDGWLPSLPCPQPGDLAAGNARIDAAAARAGRQPFAIRRLLNVNGSFSGGAAASSRGRRSNGCPSWPASPSTRGSGRSS